MRLLFFCLFACFLFNCGHPTVPRNIDVTRISKSDLQKVRSFDPTQLIDSCTYIPLETSDRILIGRVKQLKITDKYIFLVNSENDSLYVFNRQGKFLNTIGTRGRGPREYRSIQSYCFPPQADTVIIFDSDKLLFYTPTNRFIRSVDLVPQLHRDTDIIRSINSIDFAEPGKLLFKYDLMYRCNVFYSTYNYNTDELKDIGYVPLSLDLGNTLNRVNLDFFETAPYKQELSCAILYNDTIFQYRQDSLSPRFIIDALKDKVIPDRILRQLNGSDPMKAGRLLVSTGIFIKNTYESDSYFFILYNGSEPQELIWNKTTHQGILVELNDNFRGHTYAPMAVSALAVLNDDEKYYDPNNGNRYLPVSRQKQTLQFRLKEEDNPVIVIYHLKPQF